MKRQHAGMLRPHKPVKRNFVDFKDEFLITQLLHADYFTLMKEENKYYERLTKIGQGTFGEVFKCTCKTTGKLVAMKRILTDSEREGFPITAIREINMLKKMRHVNITELLDIVVSTEKAKPQFFLVFVFCDHDLAGILNRKDIKLEAVVVKTMLQHMFEGLNFIHVSRTLHRDMKTANILISKDGYLKLADFGLARNLINTSQTTQRYTNKVVTMWYRPPELLLGERDYDAKIDMWGAGCIMAEFWTRNAIFQGQSEPEQLKMIMQLCGAITKDTLPKAEKLPNLKNIVVDCSKYKRVVREKLKHLISSQTAIELIDILLSLDSNSRPSATQALEHEYFNQEPKPLENVAAFVSTLKTSCFEYTINRGPKVKPSAPANKQQFTNHKFANHYQDRIY